MARSNILDFGGELFKFGLEQEQKNLFPLFKSEMRLFQFEGIAKKIYI